MASFRLAEPAGMPAFLFIERWRNEFPEISAGFTTRHGGVSEGKLSSLNCALHVGDDPASVVENRKRLAEALQMPFDAWTCGEQVHGSRVAVVTQADKGKGRLSREDAIPDTDAMITGEPGVWLTSFYADCVPLFFYDPVKRVAGLAHAGWKGTVRRIAERTVKAMGEAFGTRAEDVRAAVGPSIGPCCYEVDGNVAEPVEACMNELGLGEEEKDAIRRPAGDAGKWMLGLQEMNRQIMIKAGILPTHIEMCGMCTGCRTDLFFSHRMENGSTGRMASWIGITLQR